MTLPEVCKQFEPYFILDDAKLVDIVKHFRKEMEEGLANYGKDMAMIPTFVTGVPDGTEEGWVLALLQPFGNGSKEHSLFMWKKKSCPL